MKDRVKPADMVGDYLLEHSEGLEEFLAALGYTYIKAKLIATLPVNVKVKTRCFISSFNGFNYPCFYLGFLLWDRLCNISAFGIY